MRSAGITTAHISTAALATAAFAGVRGTSAATPLATAGVGSNIIGTVFNNNFPLLSIAGLFNQFTGGVISTLPPPDPFSKADSVSHFILVLIEQLTAISNLLDAETPADIDAAKFNTHAQKLREGHDKLSELLAGYHTKQYLIDKIKLNAQGRAAEADRIDAAMAILSDADAEAIIILFLNLESRNVFLSQIEAKRGSYSAQQQVIKTFYSKLDRDSIMMPIIKEPSTAADNEYDSLLEQLKKGVCLCDIDNMKYLLQQYTEQLNKLTDINNFSVYVQEHPGLQHKAGVVTGGTFVMVYKGSNDATAPGIATGTVIADFYLPYTCCSNCTPVQVFIQETPTLNLPPVAAAGQNVTVPVSTGSVVLDGRASSDPDGSIQKYLWEQAQGPNTAVFDNKEIATPVVSGLVAGVYKFKLTVTDDEGATNNDSVSVNVGEQPAPQVNLCGELPEILSDFTEYESKPVSEPIKGSSYRQLYREVAKFYKLMKDGDIQEKPLPEQVDFFTVQKLNKKLPKWIEQLTPLVQNADGSDPGPLRLSALHLLVIHAKLGYYTACIQEKDIPDAGVAMQDAINALIELLEAIKVAAANFNDDQRKALQLLLKVTKAARKAIVDKGEEGSKKIYFRLLNKIIEQISAMTP